MQRSLRYKTIIQAVQGSAVVGVGALAELTGASAVTIRRDLAELAERGAIARTHGGATRPAKRGTPMPYAVRLAEDPERKQLLASAAAPLIDDDESVILDNGTTVLAVAHALAGRPLTVLALSLHAAAALASRAGARVIVPGGPVETDSLAFVGATAVAAVQRTYADVAVLGACSASGEHGLTSSTYEDAELKRACIAASRRRILVTTADKLVRTSTFRFGRPGDVTQLVTTRDAPADVLAIFREAGTDIRLA